MNQAEIKLSVAAQELDIICHSLSTRAWIEVKDLIPKLLAQANAPVLNTPVEAVVPLPVIDPTPPADPTAPAAAADTAVKE